MCMGLDVVAYLLAKLHANRHALGGDDELNLDASQVTSGVLDVARIPTLTRSKISDFFASPFWANIPDKPSTFPPSAHTHPAGDIVSGRLSLSRLPTSATANRYLVVRTANADPVWDAIKLSDLSIDADKDWGGRKIRRVGYLSVGGTTYDNVPYLRSALMGANVIADDSINLDPRSTGDTLISSMQNVAWLLVGWNRQAGTAEIDFIMNRKTYVGGFIFWSLTDPASLDLKKLLHIRGDNGYILPGADNSQDLGSSSLRWKDGYFAGTVYTGDLKFANDWVMTEKDDNGNVIEGIRILNRKGEEIFKITEDGLWFKGKKIA